MDRKPSSASATGPDGTPHGGASDAALDAVSNDAVAAPSRASSVIVPIHGSGSDAGSSAPAIKRRAPIACRRCRRMRSKCIHDKAQPPCKACSEAGLAEEDCIFPVRGQPDNDREFRHPRMRAEKLSRRDPAKVRRDILDAPIVRTVHHASDEWELLPPLSEVIDAVNRFTKHYFQLGFLPKQQFPKRLRRNHHSVSAFLVVSILSISARLSPALVARYGSSIKAADYFMERAMHLAHEEVYQDPTLERCQAFYLLSVAQQGSGLCNKSSINMGISLRMAGLMHLHLEETYEISNPTTDLIIRAESARRTLWMLHSQDQLHSGPSSPISLSATNITTLLPCSEADFAAGRLPPSRAALDDTPPAVENPALIADRNRSLFASLIQAHNFWGFVCRRAGFLARVSNLGDPTSNFALLIKKLTDWEHGLPQEHLWSAAMYKWHRSKDQHLAYLGVTMIPRLCHIIVRRPFLYHIIKSFSNPSQHHPILAQLSADLFANVRQLFDQVVAQYAERLADERVGTQMAAFCVYSCALFSTYLCKYPHICPDQSTANLGPLMVQRCVVILKECKEIWPLASRWVDILDRTALDPTTITTEGSMADSKDPSPNPITVPSSSTESPGSSTSASSSLYSRPRGSVTATPSTLRSPVETKTPQPLQNPQSQPPPPHANPQNNVHQPAIPTHFSQAPLPPPATQSYQHTQPQPLVPQQPPRIDQQPSQLNHVQPLHIGHQSYHMSQQQHPHADNHHLYVPPDDAAVAAAAVALEPRDSLGLLVAPTDYTSHHGIASQEYDLTNGNSINFYPATDGFDTEMQVFIQGDAQPVQQHQDWMQGFEGFG